MRLLSLTVRNYRVHREQTVAFDRASHLIGGPNESGKSTLAEAIHRALFLRHRSGGEVQQAMKSQIHNGHPEVTLVFEADGRTWTLEKRFSGNSGTARLASDDGQTLQGDAAEERLAELTGNAEGVATTAKQLTTRWSHLWVWQGSAGDNPAGQAADLRDQLVQRLQGQGLAAVMQSDADERAREAIRGIRDEIFTTNGAIRANSRLDRAIKDLNQASDALARATEARQRLEAEAARLEQAIQELCEVDAVLPQARDNKLAIEANLEQAKELVREQQRHQELVDQAAGRLKAIENTDSGIRGLAANIAGLRQRMVPAETRLTALQQAEQAARESFESAEAVLRDSSAALRLARQRHDLAAAVVTRMEKQASFDQWSEKAERVRSVEQRLSDQREALAQLPLVTAGDLEELRNLEAGIAQAQSALDAIAAGIECVAADVAIQLGGAGLNPGETRVITETTELRVGEGTVLKIRPGGGTTLAGALGKVAALRDQLASCLDRLAISNMADAAQIFTRRETLVQEISKTETELKALGAKGLPAAVESARGELTAAIADCARRSEALPADPHPGEPDSLESARASREHAFSKLRQAEDLEGSHAATVDARRDAWKERQRDWEAATQALGDDRRQLESWETEARILEEQHGSATDRAAAMEQARAALGLARAALNDTTSKLEELRFDALQMEAQRVGQSIARLEERQQDARNRRAAAEALLAQDGTRDPEADLLQAKASQAAALEARNREQRHADAIRLLHQLFHESQAAISESVTQPIADRVAGYLECVFGRGIRVRVDLSSDSTPTIQLIKPGEPAFDFNSLSGGTKEQVAAAVRLAMAELIAVGHDDCLPVLFDDAFAYADPARVQALQSMLYLAASRGLQVIVLSCTPADYAGLGAGQAGLSTPPRGGGFRDQALSMESVHREPSPRATTSSADSEADLSLPSAEAESAFLDALRSAGGSSGNIGLRNLLGWDEGTYGQVKNSLVARNLVAPGRGRGGSVSLVDRG